MNQKSTQLIKALCCKNNGKLPKLNCEHSDCTKCGYNWILRAINYHKKKHPFGNYKITYDQIDVVERTGKGNAVYGIQSYTVSYADFINIYIYIYILKSGRNMATPAKAIIINDGG